jgi:hypothetical protein
LAIGRDPVIGSDPGIRAKLAVCAGIVMAEPER